MKVLHVLKELKFSGAEIMYVDAAPIFQQLGCDLSVINTASKLGEYAIYFKQAGYEVFHFPYPKGYLKRLKYYNGIIKFLKKEKYDVVHIHTSDMRWSMAYCAWRAGCKSIYTFHNVFRSNWYSFLFHYWLRWSAKHIFKCTFQSISDSVYNNEKQYYHNDTIKIYNWYGSNRFFPASLNEKEKVREKLNLTKDALVIISIGGCSPIKRHTDIIKALPEVIKNYPNTIYIHLGEGNSLSEEKKLADDLGLSKYIRFYGNQKDVRQFIIASDIYVMPSKHEGIPITTIETMACKIPTILYDVPGLRDFNKENECSELIKEDYHLLAKTIIKLFSDKERQLFIINNANNLVHSNFYMDKNIKKIFNLYEK